ncbi:MAG: ribose-5-phosphate isomerase RpiA [Ignavibacteriaceae bacterium]|jgi:ribose 5-phosphate isomerase A|nr:ribose-5-phosphate isomerase RpiA [Ignavibacteriaceae bacterium]
MNEKQLAAEKSIEFIKNGMTLGLGTGSTVYFLVKKLAELINDGLSVKCVSTSKQTTELAGSLGIKIFEFNKVDYIDLTIDGADEVDENLNGIKGGGGALLFEKIAASNSKKNIWIVDSSKAVKTLGKFPLPVEVVPYGYKSLFKKFADSDYNPELRKKGSETYLTDSGNYIVDLHTGEIQNAPELEMKIKMLPGVVEVGLFNNIADVVIIGMGESTRIIKRK